MKVRLVKSASRSAISL